jgi:ubiquinol-cytochrome c reductase subunit 6
MSDEETVDPAIAIRERYGQSQECKVFAAQIVECEKRVEGGSHEDCEEELFDFLSCVDKLV